jgi:hypothetical protein
MFVQTVGMPSSSAETDLCFFSAVLVIYRSSFKCTSHVLYLSVIDKYFPPEPTGYQQQYKSQIINRCFRRLHF